MSESTGSQTTAAGGWRTWREAMRDALYGPGGFYSGGARPGAHFRTSVHASAEFAGALLRLLARVDAALGRPERLDLVDVGAGAGELLAELCRAAPPALAGRLRPVAVELAPRPPGLPERVAWTDRPPDRVTGLVIANEWLDNVPVGVVELTAGGPREVLVRPGDGAQRLGGPPDPADLEWLARWWPLREIGDRAEVGRPRCAAWAGVVGRLSAGLALAADYGHLAGDRPPAGTMTGFRDGRMVPAIPDGTCDLTAHVAVDACAAAAEAGGAAATLITDQRAALRALGVTGARPPLELARTDPAGYLAGLRRAGEQAELIDPAGLGGFRWLVQGVGAGARVVSRLRDEVTASAPAAPGRVPRVTTRRGLR